MICKLFSELYIKANPKANNPFNSFSGPTQKFYYQNKFSIGFLFADEIIFQLLIQIDIKSFAVIL